MFLIIDNYDSFVHNLARYFALSGVEYTIIRNDALSTQDIASINPQAIILSPGPCAPQQAGICIDVVKQFGATTPILGVCLGHQAIAESYGGQTIQSDDPTHGQASAIAHHKGGLFKDLPNPIDVGRYHSLIATLPDNSDLEITATLKDGTIMAIRHKTHPVYGVQFHPESVLTQHGLEMIQNFIAIAQQWNTTQEAA